MQLPDAPRVRGVMWLLNHSTLRRFDVAELRRAGVRRIYTPKRFPYDEGNLSASVDFSLDDALDIPPDDLALLNAQDWYDCDDEEAWAVANRYFDIAFIAFFARQIETVLDHFDGSIVMRVFGRGGGETYSAMMREIVPLRTRMRLRERAGSVWFGAAYRHLKDVEEPYLADRDCYLPAGLAGEDRSDDWRGGDAKLFFVCPRIGSAPYYRQVYDRFKKRFGDLPHVIGGAQPIAVSDPAVIGYVPREVHERNMRELRVMYYHSRERNHMHYHPFEAVRAGMPLVFMAGGLLDELGGKGLPGRCESEADAHRLIARLLHGDARSIERIRSTQRVLVEPILPETCSPDWQQGFARIVAGARATAAGGRIRRPARIAVIIPHLYRGGSLRGAKLLAQAIVEGSRQMGEPVTVVFGHLDDPAVYGDIDFKDLPPSVVRRPFEWKSLANDEARRALAYAGVDAGLREPTYMVPDDGVTQFDDCALWVIVSDRLQMPLLPIKPYVLMVYDYLQRYENFLPAEWNTSFLKAQHAAERVLVTTDFSYTDARDFAGLPARQLRKVPMLVPHFDALPPGDDAVPGRSSPYFVWTTNLSVHKNHANAVTALAIYYDELDGRWACRVTGPHSEQIITAKYPHLDRVAEVRAKSRGVRRNVAFLGELPDNSYRRMLANARFLWHAGRVDNGTFSVVEAAHLGVPSLVSDYPPMREIERQQSLRMAWMDPHDPEHMARALKAMETEADALRAELPDAAALAANGVERHAVAYWREVRACL